MLRTARHRLQSIGILLIIQGVLFVGVTAVAGEPWTKIEEDWELRIEVPDPQSNSPQLTIYLTPNSEQPSDYFQLQLNHAADANFSEGGFRVSAMHNDKAIDEARSVSKALLSQPDDVIRWTSVMAIRESEFLFAVKDGTSQTWGEFGGPAFLLRMPVTGQLGLSLYTPRRSVDDVDFGFGRNRIGALILKRIRAYRADGTCVTVEANLETFESFVNSPS